ncbi:MAG: hypothetical protein ABUK01_15895 [Leptospirales bacterium]
MELSSVFYRLIAYKNFQLNAINKIISGKDFSTERFLKSVQRLHNYAVSLELRAPISPTEKTLQSYYQFLELKLDRKMVALKDDYKSHLDTEIIKRSLSVKKIR